MTTPTLRNIVFMLLTAAPSAAAQTVRAAGPDSAWWTAPGPRDPRRAPTYQGVQRRSVYVPMPDGVRIAVDYYLPKSLPAGTRLPTIIETTRYQRSFRYTADSLDRIRPDVAMFVTRGYAYLVVDARGSGASFGGRRAEFDDLEVADGKSVVDWVVAQPWSDGKVGTQGVSYVGTTADLLVSVRHPAVKAAAPLFALWDAFADIVAPGGLELGFFIRDWGVLVHNMDLQTVPARQTAPGTAGVRPVDDDPDGALLREAVKGHAGNFHVDGLSGRTLYRDQVGDNGLTFDSRSTHLRTPDIRKAAVPLYGVSGWFDGGYPYAAIKRFLNVRTPGSRLLIGPWSHGSRFFWEPGRPSALTSSFDRNAETMRFFDRWIEGTPNGIDREPAVTYYTMGEDRWKTSAVWPPRGAVTRAWYLAGDHGLAAKPGLTAGTDVYQVDTTAGTGSTARWNTLLGGGPVEYPDRAEADKKLVTWTSEPLARDLEVTGHPRLFVHLASTATDGAFLGYLEAVDPEGRVWYVTEGELRGIHRAVSAAPGPYRQPTPYRTLLEKDARPMVPGKAEELMIDLLPTSYLFKKGWRIRVALAGADRDHFVAVPVGQAPTLTVYRSAARPSWIELPVIPR